MATTRNVVVNFVTKLSGRGIENMGKQTKGLDKALGTLQKRLIALVSFGAFFRFLSKSTKAVVQEAGEIRQLELALNNLGLAYTAVNIEPFIDNLEQLTTVLADELRPAFGQLVRQTADVAKAQEILTLAIDVSIGSGKSLSTVTRALGRAYDGQTTALRRLEAGISSSAIESKDFNRIQEELQKKFGGAAAANLDTYAGKMGLLKVATDKASDAIGLGVVAGIEALGEGDLQQGLADLVTLAEKLGRGLELAGRFAARVRTFLEADLGSLGDQAALTGKFLAADIALDAAERRAQTKETDRRLKLERKALKELARLREQERAKERAEERRKKAAKDAERRQEELKKRLEAKFDIDAINLNAALTRKLSEEDAARVKALQALKSDTAKDDEDALNKLIDLERKLQEDKLKAAAVDMALSSMVKNQRLADLDEEIKALKAVSAARAAAIAGASITWDTARAAISMGEATNNKALLQAGVDQLNLVMFQDLDQAKLAELESLRAEELAAGSAASAAAVESTVTTIVNNYISGNVISEQDLYDNTLNSIYSSNRTGTPSQLGGLGREQVYAI